LSAGAAIARRKWITLSAHSYNLNEHCYARYLSALVCFATLATSLLSHALAADIEVVAPEGERRVALVVVKGTLEYGDNERFGLLTADLPRALVILESEGGDVYAGIGIGRLIRAKGFATIVPEGGRCASAYAIAWLAGVPTLMAEHSLIGFHSAFDGRDNSTSGPGNAVVGAYYSELGLSDSAIHFLTVAKPGDMTWLTYADATALGLDIRYLPDDDRPSLAGVPARADPLPAPAQEADWTALGSWLQIYSRPTLTEAVNLARPYADAMGNARVYQNDNGWFTVILGPLDPLDARRRLNALLEARAIPDDSLIVSGRRFARLVWGKPPAATIAVTPASTSSAARAALEFFEMGSAPRREALSYLADVYPETVTYYGKAMPRREVLADKETFIRRWPERQYAIDPSTVRVDCSNDNICTVKGTVGWQARNPNERRLSEGRAAFVLTFDLSGRIRLLDERTDILERKRQRH